MQQHFDAHKITRDEDDAHSNAIKSIFRLL